MSYHADFTRQYNLSYIARFNQTRDLITNNPSFQEYGLPTRNIGEDISEECIVIAILFVDSKNKPSILRNKDLQADNYLIDSKTYIEDAHGRVLIEFTNSFNKLAVYSSGIVLGFIGYKNEKNIFICTDVVFPEPITAKLAAHTKDTTSQKILFISNIVLNDKNYEIVRMALDYFSDLVDEIVIFGNIFTEKSTKPDLEDFNQILPNTKLRIHLVPGLEDPTSKMIPMDPFHKMLFKSENCKNLNFLPQPAEQKIIGSTFVLMNDYIIRDLMKYTKEACSTLDVMEQLLKIRYLAPNSPDTISSVPVFKEDLLFINDCDYFVIGGSSEFTNRNYGRISMFTVPDFNKIHSAVVLNVSNNQFEEVSFKLD